MYARWLILILSLFLFSTQAIAFTVPQGATNAGTSAELTDIGLTGSEVAFGPGSTILIYDPVDSVGNRFAFVSNVEPTSVTWKIFDPNLHKIGEHTHTPSFKKQGSFNVGGQTYKWAFGDQFEFTVPAFATKGVWLLSPSFHMADGTTQSGSWTYHGVAVTRDDAFASIFSAPWYLMGIKCPALFWFPGFFFWFPLTFLGFSFIFPGAAGHLVDSIKRIREGGKGARKRWKE